MNFNCNKLELSEAITNVSKAVPSKSSIPQLEGIKISLTDNNLTLTGYNLELGITTTVNVTNNDNSSGEYIINARLFAEMVKKMPSDIINIDINKDGDMKAHLKASNTNCKIAVLSAKDYPNFPDTSMGENVSIPQQALKNMIHQTIYAVSVNDIKPILTGELFDISNGEFNLVAIDGKRLAIRHENISCMDNFKFVVPSKTLEEVSKILKDDAKATDCKIVNTSSHIMFQVDKYTIVSRLLEGEFHDYKKTIPTQFDTEVIIKVKDLTDCLERCSLLINEKNRAPIKLNFKDDTLKIFCETPLGNIDEEIHIDMTGKPLLIGLNNRFLLDSLRASDCDQVKLLMNSPIRPMTIVPMQSNSFTFLLMPIQLKDNQL
ncbi:MAG: DNA polymerase III subunit beta [Ruminococcus sp.]|nr:DNA polymerase III subunit beta [Ruminococcus sp.]MCD7801116.1 DNA polymerase III subunit beta [Ruminococcus sp.]